jgi:cation:H+ antiporter
MWGDAGLLAVGAACAGLGGEAFVRGAVRAAAIVGVRPGLIGLTLAAFATSAPELVVGVTAAVEGAPAVALGNVLGANAVNLGIALGVSLLLGPGGLGEGNLNRDVAATLVAALLLGAFMLDGRLTRIEAFLLFAVFAAWLFLVVREERAQRAIIVPMPRSEAGAAAAYLAGGLALLVVSGETFVAGAKGLAMHLGWDLFIVGATLVAVGTTLPELATSVIAKLRGQDEIGLGTIFGSCIFNTALIVPVTAWIQPPAVPFRDVAVAAAAGAVLVLAALPVRGSRPGRARGLLLLALYAAYVAALLVNRPSAV